MSKIMNECGWFWKIGRCGCGATGVPLANDNDQVDPSCANCLQRVVDELRLLGGNNHLKVGDLIMVKLLTCPAWIEREITNIGDDVLCVGSGMGTQSLYISDEGKTWKRKT
jgi:hypothetical protein